MATLPYVIPWPNNEIPYDKNSIKNLKFRNDIERQIKHLEDNTPVRFIGFDDNDSLPEHHIKFIADGPNFVENKNWENRETSDALGFVPEITTIHVTGNMWILHEIVHCVGLIHEHSRNDRDTFLLVPDGAPSEQRTYRNENQIMPDSLNFGVPFDGCSCTDKSDEGWWLSNYPGDSSLYRLTFQDVMSIRALYSIGTDFESIGVGAANSLQSNNLKDVEYHTYIKLVHFHAIYIGMIKSQIEYLKTRKKWDIINGKWQLINDTPITIDFDRNITMVSKIVGAQNWFFDQQGCDVSFGGDHRDKRFLALSFPEPRSERVSREVFEKDVNDAIEKSKLIKGEAEQKGSSFYNSLKNKYQKLFVLVLKDWYRIKDTWNYHFEKPVDYIDVKKFGYQYIAVYF